jgi:DNA polymerase III epsilon subunit family exonuclease
MLEQPDDDQRRVILAPLDNSILVLAGPGAGKTRTLIGRIGYLLAKVQVPADGIVAVTFTNRAARHLQTRLAENLRHLDVPQWVGTFHALAYQILKEFPNVVDVPPAFAVSDERDKEVLLRRAWEVAGMGAHPQKTALTALIHAFSLCKRNRHDPAECNGDHLPSSEHFTEKQRQRLAVAYHRLLRDYQRLDFDDLILYASELLYNDEAIAEGWHRSHPWLFVDEFQDIDPAQYQFLQLLAPPGRGRVMAVLDGEQRIYSWRGAESGLLGKFRKLYQPRQYELRRNYRSGSQIAVACDRLLACGKVERTTNPQRAEEGTRHRRWFTDPQEEAQWLTGEIKRLESAGLKLGQMAILYRHHKVGELLEPLLRQQGIEARRIRREPFLERREAQELLRYLEAAAKRGADAFAAALNFPRVVADEFTMAHLQGLAREEGLSFGELLQKAEALRSIGPATRAQIRAFLRAVDTTLVPQVHAPMEALNQALFRLIEQRRSPYPYLESATLRGAVAFVERFLPWRDLRAALIHRPVVHVVAEASVDGWCAAGIVAGALRHFLLLEVRVTPRREATPPDTLRIVCGAAEVGVLSITEADAGSLRYPAAFIAWQTMAAVMLSFERFHTTEFAVMDLETTGIRRDTDRPVELAALRLKGLRVQDEGWHTLANPERPIEKGATNVHGIDTATVQNERSLAEVVPEFLEYLGKRTLVGHNIRDFDVPLLAMEAKRAGLPPVTHDIVDTLDLARRLLPDMPNHKLETLVEHCKLPMGVHHRAMDDVEHTYHVLCHLWDQHTYDQRLHLLTGALPLVAMALQAKGVEQAEGQLFMAAGGRVLQRESDPALWNACWESLPDPIRTRLEKEHSALATMAVPLIQDDGIWGEVRDAWEQFTRDVVRQTRDTSLETFLSYANLSKGEADEQDEHQLGMMTIHAAKGKEFRVVFLVGFEEKEMPSWRSKSAEEQEEERRVAYVGMSRAADTLYLVGCEYRNGYSRAPSRFWRELDRLF